MEGDALASVCEGGGLVSSCAGNLRDRISVKAGETKSRPNLSLALFFVLDCSVSSVVGFLKRLFVGALEIGLEYILFFWPPRRSLHCGFGDVTEKSDSPLLSTKSMSSSSWASSSANSASASSILSGD